jgi:hypothetical protein
VCTAGCKEILSVLFRSVLGFLDTRVIMTKIKLFSNTLKLRLNYVVHKDYRATTIKLKKKFKSYKEEKKTDYGTPRV